MVNSPNNSSVRLSHHLSATIPCAYNASSTISSSSTNNSSNKEIDHLGYRLDSLALGLNNTSVFSQASSKSHALGSSASRLFSTNASEDAVGSSLNFKSHDSESEYMLLPFLPRGKKLKPHVVKKRLSKMKTYIGTEKNIRHSPWRLNLICQFAAGQTVNDALMQLQFCQKGFAPLVATVIQRTANLADIRHDIQFSQLEVAECFATPGTPLKRITFHSKGRFGKRLRRHSHIRLVLREIDFELKILQANTISEKRNWLMLKKQAEDDYEMARKEKRELKELQKLKEEADAKKAEEASK